MVLNKLIRFTITAFVLAVIFGEFNNTTGLKTNTLAIINKESEFTPMLEARAEFLRIKTDEIFDLFNVTTEGFLGQVRSAVIETIQCIHDHSTVVVLGLAYTQLVLGICMLLNVGKSFCLMNTALVLSSLLLLRFPKDLEDYNAIQELVVLAICMIVIEILCKTWRSTSGNLPGLKSSVPTPETRPRRMEEKNLPNGNVSQGNKKKKNKQRS
ncbi:unnamed protein product [Moneuplotes crassus]|uniref:Uncharacterized protein n=1 Tax=Euplotes crassus TaxID=5936 RepID=A0AAD1XY20_EUPCR|nr:unnamed protein product [Moneuplotes crassus]